MRTYRTPRSSQRAARSSFSEIGGSSIAPIGRCFSRKVRTSSSILSDPRSTGRTSSARSLSLIASSTPRWKFSTVCAFGLSWSSAIRKLRRKASARACGLGTKPSCSIAFSTAARVLSVRNSDRLITRLTVFFDTPARAATSLIVGCLPPGPLFCAAIFALSPAGPLARLALYLLMGARTGKINCPARAPTPLDTGYHQN